MSNLRDVFGRSGDAVRDGARKDREEDPGKTEAVAALGAHLLDNPGGVLAYMHTVNSFKEGSNKLLVVRDKATGKTSFYVTCPIPGQDGDGIAARLCDDSDSPDSVNGPGVDKWLLNGAAVAMLGLMLAAANLAGQTGDDFRKSMKDHPDDDDFRKMMDQLRSLAGGDGV